MYTTREFSLDMPQLNGKQHKFIAYSDEGDSLLHYSSKFGYTQFSQEVDGYIISNSASVIDANGKVNKRKHFFKIEGRELIVYNDDGSVIYDEWVYIDRSKIVPVLIDINGYELYF